MHRFFTDNITGDTAIITGEDVKHIARVLRLTAGDSVEICDGAGYDHDGTVISVEKERVVCRVTNRRASDAEPNIDVTLFQCLPKTGKTEVIAQKCTELGVSTVVPVLSTRCVALPGGNYDAKIVRYRRVMLEAAKQSHRSRIPSFSTLERIESIDPSRFDLFLIAYEDERGTTLKSVLRAHASARSVAVLIGPEGGLTADEVERLTRAGGIAVSLGKRILRTETAGPAAISAILYELDM